MQPILKKICPIYIVISKRVKFFLSASWSLAWSQSGDLQILVLGSCLKKHRAHNI
jgi:hypothetical protein